MTYAAAFSGMGARQRAESLLDAGSFQPLTDLTSEAPLLVGSGLLSGAPVLLALTDGRVHGGTIGLREASALARLADSAAASRMSGRPPAALIIGFDTGGVRVEEGPIALAATSAVGVALARLTLLGMRLAAIISGPRGCFGAPAVMAALPQHIVMTESAHWGLTGPKLLDSIQNAAAHGGEGMEIMSAAARLANGDAHAVVADDAGAVRAELASFVTAPADPPPSMLARIAASAEITATLQQRLFESGWPASRAPVKTRRRDLLRYSFRRQWKPSGFSRRRGLVNAALGALAERPALGFIVGSEQTRASGVGIEEAAVVTEMLQLAASQNGARAAILTFLFCQGHAVDFAQERYGLHRALAECLRAMVAARLLGHPIISILGGGTYGAAYLALAAPSHRVLAMRGTAVAPMSPQVLAAFQALRGRKAGDAPQLADLIPDVRIVESVIRLPRAVGEELATLLATVRPEVEAA
jgi:malonate decarboxylase beta subunit